MGEQGYRMAMVSVGYREEGPHELVKGSGGMEEAEGRMQLVAIEGKD